MPGSTVQRPSAWRRHCDRTSASRQHGACRRSSHCGIEREGRAVEHQLVLAAHLVDIEERQPALLDAGDGEGDALVALVALEGRAVDDDQHLGAALATGSRSHRPTTYPRTPARRAARRGTAMGPGARPGAEHALLVEDAVIRQIVFEAQRRDLAAVGEHARRCRACRPAATACRASTAGRRRGLAREPMHRRLAGLDEGRLQHQILGRIARDEELACHHEIGARAAPPRPRAVRNFARLPVMSPTVGSSWAMAIESRSVMLARR